MSFEDIEKAIRGYHPSPNIEIVKKAYFFAQEKHKDQKRQSGEPYFVHLEQTALIACRLCLDEDSVCAALLHDCMEDQGVTKQELEEEFNPEVAQIVEGVTKIPKANFYSGEEAQAENFRKMLLAIAKDIRVILIKLCDRMHNMRTLDACSEEKQIRISKETKDIYVPLANRLGIFWFKSELDDLCFRYLRPTLYEEIKRNLEEKKIERDKYIQTTIQEIQAIMDKNKIQAQIKGRVKNIASLGGKMIKKNIEFSQIRDLLGFRIIVTTVGECYEVLGLIHSKWTPVPGRFKDYIAMPKSNMYQSLHTLVKGPLGQEIELQIRTKEMDHINEEGIAAHWRYKEDGTKQAFDLQWVKSLVESQQYIKNSNEFIQSVKSELFPEEVFVFTPKGDLIHLPADSTPVDFAYAVHTNLGNTITGAKVNGGIVPLNYCLQNGDTVDVQCSKNQTPKADWLFFVQSSKAKQRIRVFLRTEEREKALIEGTEILTRELKKIDVNINKLSKAGVVLEVAKSLGFKSEEELYYQIGFGKANLQDVILKLAPDSEKLLKIQEEKQQQVNAINQQHEESTINKIFRNASSQSQKKLGVRINDMSNMVVGFAKCCTPLPGDPIIGYISRGRGVIIHHVDCPEAQRLDPERQVKVQWESDAKKSERVKLVIYSNDRIGTMADLSKVISDNRANIYSMSSNVDEFAKAITHAEIGVQSAKQLDQIIRSLQKVAGTNRVEKLSVNKTEKKVNKKEEVKKKVKNEKEK